MIEQTFDLRTADGAVQTFRCRPERAGPYPAVLMLMDAPGIREELRDMARRLATCGRDVLLPNLYYRAGRDTLFGPEVMTEGSAVIDICERAYRRPSVFESLRPAPGCALTPTFPFMRSTPSPTIRARAAWCRRMRRRWRP